MQERDASRPQALAAVEEHDASRPQALAASVPPPRFLISSRSFPGPGEPHRRRPDRRRWRSAARPTASCDPVRPHNRWAPRTGKRPRRSSADLAPQTRQTTAVALAIPRRRRRAACARRISTQRRHRRPQGCRPPPTTCRDSTSASCPPRRRPDAARPMSTSRPSGQATAFRKPAPARNRTAAWSASHRPHRCPVCTLRPRMLTQGGLYPGPATRILRSGHA